MYQAFGETGLNEVLARRLTTPGGASAPAVAPEMFPVIVLENDRPEWLHLAGSRLMARATPVGAGGAGTRSKLSLVNQTTENSFAVIERIDWVVASGGVRMALSANLPGSVPFGSQLRGVSRDGRDRNASSLLLIADNTLAASGTTFYLGGASGSIEVPIVLSPDYLLEISPDADNVELTACSVVWRERQMEPGERR